MAIRSWIRIPGFHFPHHCRIWHFIGSSFFNILIQSLMLMFTKRGEVTDTDKGTQFWKGSSQWTGHPDPDQSGFASGITFSWGWSFSGMVGVGGGMLFVSASCFLWDNYVVPRQKQSCVTKLKLLTLTIACRHVRGLKSFWVLHCQKAHIRDFL